MFQLKAGIFYLLALVRPHLWTVTNYMAAVDPALAAGLLWSLDPEGVVRVAPLTYRGARGEARSWALSVSLQVAGAPAPHRGPDARAGGAPAPRGQRGPD